METSENLSHFSANSSASSHRHHCDFTENSLHRLFRTDPECLFPSRTTVFLIHGWGGRAISMGNLARALARHGYTVFNYDYPTFRKNIEEHARVFLEAYRKTLRTEAIDGEVYFVTHSMGGLILRSSMAEMTAEECRQIKSVVMLGPPNRGSGLAVIGRNALVRSVNASLGDMGLGRNAYVQRIPAPLFLPPAGIIAGKYDGKVTAENTLLPEGQPCSFTMVNCTHPGSRNPARTLRPILHFLEKKSFQ